MSRLLSLASILFFALTSSFPAFSQAPVQPDPLHYADLADLSVNAPIIARVFVKRAIKVDPERAPNAPPGTRRFYVEGETEALIRGQNGIPDTIRYIIDLPLDARGRAPKIKKNSYIIFAKSPRGGGELQLVAPDAQIRWTQQRDDRIRTLVREIVARDAPPAISRIASAFHVPGTIIGEGETQIFAETESSNLISITILSREGRSKIWAVSLGEIVDEAARAPLRNTLLWYRLACFLPKGLPYSALSDSSAANAERARADYNMVLRDLGACPRSRPGSSL